MEYHSPRSTGQFNRSSNVVGLDEKRWQRRTHAGTRLLCIGVLGAAFGASTPFVADWVQRAAKSSSPVSIADTSFRRGIVICKGGDRRARKVTCLVDGDTGWEDGIKWRLDNIDTPELNSPGCSNERRKAIQAWDRLQELMNAGYKLVWVGSTGSYGRQLVRIRLADGRFAGTVLLAEGLAQPWPNTGNVWCGS